MFLTTTVQDGLDFNGWIIVFLLLVTLFFLIKEYFPPDITLLIAGTIPLFLGIVSKKEYLLSFANETIVTIGMLFVVARAFEKTGLLFSLSKKILPENKSMKRDLSHLLFPIAGLSAFINNTPLIVMLTPFLRRWAILQGKSPSKYLIPLSFAAIFGGACTLIGTSTNLVVSFFLDSFYPGAGFSFFEIGKVGIFCAILGIVFIILFANKLLPERVDPKVAISAQMQDVIGEFLVMKKPFANLTIHEFSDKYLEESISIVAVERAGQTIPSPSPDFMIIPDDRIVVCGDHQQIVKLYSLKGLKSVSDPSFHLEQDDRHYSELVIPSNSDLVGKTLKSSQFRDRFGGSVFALFREGKPFFSKISTMNLQAGDVLMVLSAKPRQGNHIPKSKDIFFINPSQELTYFSVKKRIAVVCGIIGMIGLAISGVPMMLCATGTAVFFLLFRIVSARDIVKRINWNLLILIAGGLSLAKGVELSKVAHVLAENLLYLVGNHPQMLILSLFIITIVLTELITNVAAALIVLPIALNTVDLSLPNAVMMIKAIGITTAIAASCSFLTPIGYQTNTIIYGPGGYRFSDYCRLGIFLTVFVGGLVTYLVPYFWQIG